MEENKKPLDQLLEEFGDDPPLFPMKNASKAWIWEHIQLIAPSRDPTRQWKTSEAIGAFCQKCREVMPFTISNTKAPKRHMEAKHIECVPPEELPKPKRRKLDDDGSHVAAGTSLTPLPEHGQQSGIRTDQSQLMDQTKSRMMNQNNPISMAIAMREATAANAALAIREATAAQAALAMREATAAQAALALREATNANTLAMRETSVANAMREAATNNAMAIRGSAPGASLATMRGTAASNALAMHEAAVANSLSLQRRSSNMTANPREMGDNHRNHRIISPPGLHPSGEDRLLAVTEHLIAVPLYRDDKPPHIDLFFTVVEKVNDFDWFKSLVPLSPTLRAAEYVSRASLLNADDMMLFLQGGPGFGSPTPIVDLSFAPDGSWAESALRKYSRIVLMDQRGTGRSNPITKRSLEAKFPDLFMLDRAEDMQAKSMEELKVSHLDKVMKMNKALTEATRYMSQFRAESIVQDAEDVKDALMLPAPNNDGRPWGCVLGQSFGGFCVMTYLSKVPRPPRICLLTGGIAPMLTDIKDVYASLWDRVKERNLRYYARYSGDIRVVKKIVKKLLQVPAILPSGGKLTARRFLQLGLKLGGSPSAFSSLHKLMSQPFVKEDAEELEFSMAFLKGVEMEQKFDDNPLYFWLHEMIYADGMRNSPTEWAAHRAFEDLMKSRWEFDYRLTSFSDSDSRPTLFFGEMVFPWMTEDFDGLSGVGMTALANSLASKSDWGPLYDGDCIKAALADGSSKVAAAVYYDDMYVDFDASMKVTARGNPLELCKVWVTNEYQHSGLRDDGSKIFRRLHGMAKSSVNIPS